MLTLLFTRWLVLVPILTGMGGIQPRSFYEENRVYRDKNESRKFLPLASPESHGLDPAAVERTAKFLAERPESRALLIIRNRHVVAEHYFHGATRHESRNVHSASKSVISALVGIAMERGKLKGLDQPLFEILPEDFPKEADTRRKKITIEHLLAMKGGLRWNEDLTEHRIEISPHWVRAILGLQLVSDPGTAYNYSTALTHLASAALTRSTGMSTRDFAAKTLFGPLGITPEHWGRDPQGIDSGGCNLFITPRELALFGQLYLDSGRWKGKQIVPEKWIADSFRKRHDFDPICGYGYGWWLFQGGGHNFAVAWGYGGQFLFVFPDHDTCVVITADTKKRHEALQPWAFYTEHLIPMSHPPRETPR